LPTKVVKPLRSKDRGGTGRFTHHWAVNLKKGKTMQPQGFSGPREKKLNEKNAVRRLTKKTTPRPPKWGRKRKTLKDEERAPAASAPGETGNARVRERRSLAKRGRRSRQSVAKKKNALLAEVVNRRRGRGGRGLARKKPKAATSNGGRGGGFGWVSAHAGEVERGKRKLSGKKKLGRAHFTKSGTSHRGKERGATFRKRRTSRSAKESPQDLERKRR